MKSLDGYKMLWVWNYDQVLGGNPERMAQRALEYGVRALAFKHDDGGHPFLLGQFPALVRRFKEVCQSHGIAFGLWGYHYGRQLDEEASMVELALTYEPDFYIVDWEIELMGQPVDSVNSYLGRIVSSRGELAPETGLFHAPLAQPRYHKPALYQSFCYALDGMMPQIYHQAMGLQYDVALQLCYEDYATYGLTSKPIWPAGQAYDIPAEEVLAWGTRAVEVYKAKGLSWWSFEHISQSGLEAIRNVQLGGEMRRVNGEHPSYTTDTILQEGTETVHVRQGFGLLATDQRVVLDIELRGLPAAPWPVTVVRDAGGAFAGYLDADKPRDQIPVYITGTGAISLEVVGGRAKVALLGILEAG